MKSLRQQRQKKNVKSFGCVNSEVNGSMGGLLRKGFCRLPRSQPQSLLLGTGDIAPPPTEETHQAGFLVLWDVLVSNASEVDGLSPRIDEG